MTQKKLLKAQSHLGCEVKLEVWDDMVHVFHGYAPFLPEANEAFDVIANFISNK